jgi:hypothetical protein
MPSEFPIRFRLWIGPVPLFGDLARSPLPDAARLLSQGYRALIQVKDAPNPGFVGISAGSLR